MMMMNLLNVTVIEGCKDKDNINTARCFKDEAKAT